MTITDISSKLKINRNSVSKYLEVLLISGQVETQSYGTAHVFFLTHRVPISAMLSISSHLVLTLDESNKVLFCNDNFLTFFEIARDQIVGHHIIEIYRHGIPEITFSELFSDILANPDQSCETAITRQNETYYFRIKGVKTVFDDGCRGTTIVMEDETKERKHQIQLEMNEVRYRGIVEDQTEFICRFLPDGILTFINDSFAKFLKRTPEDLVNKCQIPGISCEDAALWDQTCKTLDREHAVTTIICRMPDGTGRDCWTAWTIRGLFDGTDEGREYQAVGRDITEKKETDAQLQAYVDQMEFFSRKMQEFSELPPDADIYKAIGNGLYEVLPDAIISVNSYDPESGTLTIRNVMSEQMRDCTNRYFEKPLVGLKIHVDEHVPERLLSGKLYHIQEEFYNVLFRHLPKEACEKITKALNLGEFYSVGLVWNGMLFGNITFGLQTGVPLTNVPLIEDYARVSSIALQRQVAEDKLRENERKLADEALKVSENYLHTIFNSTQSGLVVIDPDSHTVFDINSTAIAMIGRKKSEIIGSSCKSLFCLAENDKCPVTDLHQKLARSECTLLLNDGKKKTVLKTVVPVQIGNRSYLLESILDISERKQAEEALKESEKKFRETVRYLDEGYYGCTPDGKLLEHNLAFSRILGIDTAHQLKGISLTDFWQNPAQREEYLAKLSKKGFIRNYLINAKTISGKEIIILANAHTVRDEAGTVIKIAGTFSDFTERKRAEDALRESEERYRSLAETAQDFIYIIDKNDNVVYVNNYCVKMLKMSRLDIIGKPRKALFPEPVASTQYKNLQRVFTTGIPFHEESNVLISGQKIWQDTRLVPLKDADGTISAVLGISRDITRLKQVEETLRESEMKFRDLAEMLPQSVWECDAEGNLTFANSGSFRMYGYDLKDLDQGLNIWQMMHPDDRERVKGEVVNGFMHQSTDFPEYYQYTGLRKDGSTFPIEIYATIIVRNGQPVGMRGIGIDISERKRAEDALQQANKKLTLLSSISRHDINNQLTILRGYLNILQEKQSDVTRDEYFGKVSTAAQRISSMIQFTKEYEKIGVNSPSWQDCRILIDTAAKQAPLEQVLLKNDLPANVEVFADPLVIKVCYNLIDNAVRYGKKIKTIRFSVLADDDDYVVVCEDDGVGVPVEEKEKIFEQGFGKNTGFGLALSREILSITGITIRETGEPGKGARFEVTVPKGTWRMKGDGA
ncbi:MAG: PAS domain S-box protein [Methanoregula sp.]|nr:PAS domain S-box protein [Methanoregula sp.]